MEREKPLEKTHQLTHRKTVIRAGAVAIIVNLILTVVKITIGAVSGSLAIFSDAIHGVVDSLAGVIVIVSEKIKPQKTKSGRTLDHATIEKIGARIIAVIILLVAAHIIIEAVAGLFNPPEINLSIFALVILTISIVAKVALAIYLRKTSQKTRSVTLKASSVESLNDSIISFAVLLSTLVYLISGFNIEAYVSILVAVFIAKSGLDLLKP